MPRLAALADEQANLIVPTLAVYSTLISRDATVCGLVPEVLSSEAAELIRASACDHAAMMKAYLPSSWTSRTTGTGDNGAAEAAALDKLRPAGSNILAMLPSSDVLGAFCARGVAAADAVLLEFLRLCSGDARKAESAVKVMAEWRRSVKVWEAGTERGDVMKFLGSTGVEFPMWMDTGGRIGYLMVKHVPKKFSYPKMEKGVGVLLDWVLYTKEGLEPANGLIAISDFSGFSVSQADVRALTITVRTYMKAYPGAFRKIIMVNYPVAIYGCTFSPSASVCKYLRAPCVSFKDDL